LNITVGTADLRAALRSVTPHAHPEPEATTLHRLRLDVGPENMTVSATNLYTVGHAIVSIWDNADSEVGTIKQVLALFHGKDADDEQPQDMLRIESDREHTTLTDVSGLLELTSLQLMRHPQGEFPDVTKAIADKLTAKKRRATERVITNSTMLGLFLKAAAAYKQPLVIDPSGSDGAMLISCGESFLGLLTPARLDEDMTAKINGWHADWLVRIDATNPELVNS
jgi:hypothetical protein